MPTSSGEDAAARSGRPPGRVNSSSLASLLLLSLVLELQVLHRSVCPSLSPTAFFFFLYSIMIRRRGAGSCLPEAINRYPLVSFFWLLLLELSCEF